VVALLFTLLSCKKENIIQPNSTSEVILPLSAGNTWKYQRKIIDTVGIIVQTDTVTMIASGPDTIVITKSDTIISGRLPKITTTGSDTIGFTIGYLMQGCVLNVIQPFGLLNESDGLYAATVYPPPSYSKALPFPTSVGDTVIYDHYLFKTKTLNQSIGVLAGTFTCIDYDVYLSYANIICLEMWCAPNVGIVKLSEKINYYTYEYQLISFALH
jgi:hypothetical protein